MADWKVGASRTLPIASDESWDGSGAAAAIFEWAGGDDFDSAKARKGFLVYDAEKTDERGSYKLPFAIVSGGSLKASPAGIRAAASRLPQTDIPADVQTKAQAVIDHYEDRMGIGSHDSDSDEDDKAAPVCRKMCAARIKAVNADDDTMAAINEQSLVPLQPGDVFVGQMHLANTQLDRSDEKFPVSYLQRFAQTLPGKSVMRGHDYSNEPVGRFFDAEVMPDTKSGGHYLRASYYLDANGPITNAVKMGIAKDVSIGFMPDKRICDLDGKDYDGWMTAYAASGTSADDQPCSHIKGRMYNGQKCTVTYGGDLTKVEAQEGSFVWLGCQRGAQTMKDAQAADTAKADHFDALVLKAGGKGETMEKELAALQARVKELEAENASLRPLAEDGETYRKWQKAEIARLYTSMGEEKAAATMLKALDAADAEALEEVRQEVDARHAKAFARGGAQTDGAATEPKTAGPRPLNEILWGAGRRQGG